VGHAGVPTSLSKVNNKCFARLSSVSATEFENSFGARMDALARKFHETHDMTVKDEIERLARERGKLKEPWEFVSR
jgi:hypothetical protein